MSDYRRGLDWWLDLLTTLTHDSLLQVIIVPSLIFTLYKSLHHTLSTHESFHGNGFKQWRFFSFCAHAVAAQRISQNSELFSQSVSKSWCRAPRPDVYYSLTVTVLPAQSFSRPSPLGLATIFYCLIFETSLSVASYDSCSNCSSYNISARTAQKTRS
jgi:hypothetical protein